MTKTLDWAHWSWTNRQTFAITGWQVMQQMQAWIKTLNRQELDRLLKTQS